MTTEKSSKNVAIFSVIAIILLLISAYLFYQNAQLKKEVMGMKNEYIMLEEVNHELDSQYMEAEQQLLNLKGDNALLNQRIDEQIQELAKQKNEISSLISRNKNYQSAKNEISELKATLEQYVEEITELKNQNDLLGEENQFLKNTASELNQEIERTQFENKILSTEKAELAEEKQKLASVNTALSKTVSKASIIPVTDLEVKGYMSKEGGKDVRRRRANNVDKLEICFTANVNEIAKEGKEVFHIRIISPQGETISVEDAGSGTMTLTDTDTKIQYSLQKSIDYKSTTSDQCFQWAPEIPFTEGTYVVEVYNKGFLSASESFKLR